MTAMRQRLLAGALATVVLLAVFGAYLRPDFAMTIANQIWNCF